MADDAHSTGFLDLPPELRLLVYEHLLADPIVAIRCLAGGGNETKSPWALLRVCRLITQEAIPVMPAVAKISFQFSDVEDAAMWRWCLSMRPDRISQMRKISMNGSGVCLTGWDEATGRKSEAPACFRTISLDFARGFKSACAPQYLDRVDSSIPPTPPSHWRSLDALQSARFCQHACLGCRYCTQVVAVGQVSKVAWTIDGQPKPTAELLLDLVDTTTKDISECLCPQGCGIEGCNQHRGELSTAGSTEAFLQLLRSRDYNERYLVY